MPRKQLDQLKEKRAALDARIRATEARLRTQERKRDTRRKVLAGAAVLYHAEHDTAFHDELRKVLDGFLSRDDERDLFELPRKSSAA